MRFRALGISAIVFAFILLNVSTASGWTQLAPITPDAPNAMIYTKGLALDSGAGGSVGIWVTDVGSDKVYKFPLAPTGTSTQPIQMISGSFTGGGSLDYPGGIAVNSANGNIYVADTGNDRIMMFGPTGMLLDYTYGNSGTGVIALKRPHGLKIVGNTLYIANSDVNGSGTSGVNRGIKRVSLDLDTWGGDIKSSEFLTGPSDVAVDTANNRMWAADEGFRAGESDSGVTSSMKGRVVKFDLSGNKLATYQGSPTDALAQPYSVEYDAAANVLYMGDYAKNTIYVLNADDGEILDRIGTTSPISPNTPVSLAFASGSRILYVGQVGTKTGGAGAREIERFQTGAPPSCSATSNVTTAFETAAVVNLSCDGGSDTLRYEITSGPLHGSFGAPSNGGVTRTYTPSDGYSGSDQFAFRVVTKRGLSQIKTVSISVGSPPMPTPPTGPTTPIDPTSPVVTPSVILPLQPIETEVTLGGLRIAKIHKSKIKISGKLRIASKNNQPLQESACAGSALATLSVKRTRKTQSGKVTLLHAIKSDFLSFRGTSGACTAKFALTTKARNRHKSLVIKLSHPGNDTMLPASKIFSVTSAHK